MADTDLGDELSLFLADLKLSFALFRSADFKHDFFTVMREEFNKTGLDAINPDNFVVEMNAGGKERSIKNAKESKWPRPYQPFCFQTRGDCGTLFFVFQCWQDGLRKMLSVLKDRSCDFWGTKVHVGQIYEHCWGERRVSRLLIDWEALSSWFGGQRTPEQIRESALKFPAWFARNLMKHGAIEAGSRVKCVVKDKSRPSGDCHKISFHFIFDIAGVPRGSHRIVLGKTLEGSVSHLKLAHEAKTFTVVPGELIDAPWIGLDWRTFAGGHGFSTLFSRKKEDDPNPLLPCYMVVSKENVERQDFMVWKDKSPYPDKLKEKISLAMLYRASYTVPSPDSVQYKLGILKMCQVLKKSAPGSQTPITCHHAQNGAPGPKPLHRRHTSPAQNILPQWFQSAWKQGYTINTSAPCLQEGGVLHKSLKRHVSGENVKLAHVQNIPCPIQMYKKKVHIHSSNGIFVAVQEDTVYATCSVCKLEETVKNSDMAVTEGKLQETYRWVIWDEESFKKGLAGTFTQPTSRCICSKKG